MIYSYIITKNILSYFYESITKFRTITEKKDILRLYTAEKLAGPWLEHPDSPIAESRNAGSLCAENGRIFRFAQRKDAYYGDGVDLFEITKLSPERYREQITKEKFIKKGHHCNIIRFNGQKLIVRDHAFLSFMPFEFVRRVLNVLKRLTVR